MKLNSLIALESNSHYNNFIIKYQPLTSNYFLYNTYVSKKIYYKCVENEQIFLFTEILRYFLN